MIGRTSLRTYLLCSTTQRSPLLTGQVEWQPTSWTLACLLLAALVVQADAFATRDTISSGGTDGGRDHVSYAAISVPAAAARCCQWGQVRFMLRACCNGISLHELCCTHSAVLRNDASATFSRQNCQACALLSALSYTGSPPKVQRNLSMTLQVWVKAMTISCCSRCYMLAIAST